MNCLHFINQTASSNSIVPIIAIVVSCISLIFSFFTARHNRKTVEPLLTHIYSSDISAIDKPHPNQSIKIKNCGFGPAVIKSLLFTLDDKQYKNLLVLFNENLKNSVYEGQSYHRILDDYVIATNDEVLVFEISFLIDPSSKAFLQLRELLYRTILNIEYKTIYGKSIHYSKPILRKLNTRPL